MIHSIELLNKMIRLDGAIESKESCQATWIEMVVVDWATCRSLCQSVLCAQEGREKCWYRGWNETNATSLLRVVNDEVVVEL